MKKFRKIEFAEQVIVEKFYDQIEELVDLYDLKIDECLITDESLISDFEDIKADKIKLNTFKKKYGFLPESNQYLYEVAQKMVCKRKK